MRQCAVETKGRHHGRAAENDAMLMLWHVAPTDSFESTSLMTFGAWLVRF